MNKDISEEDIKRIQKELIESMNDKEDIFLIKCKLINGTFNVSLLGDDSEKELMLMGLYLAHDRILRVIPEFEKLISSDKLEKIKENVKSLKSWRVSEEFH